MIKKVKYTLCNINGTPKGISTKFRSVPYDADAHAHR